MFKHVIGKSTLTEGIAIPRSLESWVNASEFGCKRDIILHFNGVRIIATLRRIANARGNVQPKINMRLPCLIRWTTGVAVGYSENNHLGLADKRGVHTWKLYYF